ncbi:aldehyde dehydrogenase [Shimia sp. MMG029]|uniref:aldehyde dehydrogenase n=1 Tax=Shimia sp. MMG029 TaxID=3021978 RepID=UPI0022FE114D|nr:aldehyde dehydrogenase [Shimia sp. MMG029]MDA5558495.1 aldehyde dehydrogenase [Shimia sp. MMG029]
MNAQTEITAVEARVRDVVANQRTYFRTKATLPVDFRIAQLKKLGDLLRAHEQDFYDAIYNDFGKSKHHTQLTELLPIFEELKTALKNLQGWAKPRKVPTNLINQPGKSYIVPEPLGTSLVIGAWNFPYNLSLIPVIGSMMAGNTTVLKPSELPAETSRIMAKIINENFDPGYLHVVEGAVAETTALLNQRWDKIFFTGSPQVGKIVNTAAAPHLTNVTLELGGKNPAIITEDASINVSVKRLIWAKFINSGQLCLAPDYVLVHKSIKTRVMERMVAEIEKHNYTVERGNFTRIINERNFDRVAALIEPEKVYFGGKSSREDRVIQPTIVHNVSPDDAIMQDEIFGPIIAVLEYDTLDEAFDIVRQLEKPLAGYLFSNDKATKQRFLAEIPFGSGAINDAVMQITNANLPFGGVGNSGIGRYHGAFSFECFSHMKPVLEKTFDFETNLKYYGHSDRQMKWIKRLG